MERLRRLINGALALLVLGGAAAFTAWLIATRPEPSKNLGPPRISAVAVAALVPRVFDAPVVGYGTVRPKNQVKIVPQVSGMITDTHLDLAVGKIIPDGEILFEIDKRAYESQVLRVEAEIKLLEAQLRRHEREKINLTDRLQNAQELLDLARADLKREEELLEQGAARQIEVDAARERYLQRSDVVIAYQNQLALIPFLVEETNARLEAGRAQLDDARRNVEQATIRCPFEARVDVVSAKTSQVVIANLAIATLTDMEAFEIAAVLDPSDLQWSDRRAYARAMGSDLGEPPAVTVTWTLHGRRYSWRGHVSRLERHDEATRTARLVVEIPNSPDAISSEPGFAKPQLSIGMFCAAEIPAERLTGALVLPRSAIHEDNTVYVFEPDAESPDGLTGRLASRTVPVLRSVGDEVLVDFVGRDHDGQLRAGLALARCELQAGELVILSPVPRAVVGMKLRRRTTAAHAGLTDGLLALAAHVSAIDLPLLASGNHYHVFSSNRLLRTVIPGDR